MIRKQTWILLVIFAVITGAAFYLQKNPIKNTASLTPSPTSQPRLVKDWLAEDITQIAYKDAQGVSFLLEHTELGSWVFQPDERIINDGKVAEILAEITNAQIITTLDPKYDLASVGLVSSYSTLTLTQSNGDTMEIKIGQMTPTSTGYYVQVGHDAPSVVSRGAVDSMKDLLTKENLLDITPTPESTATPDLAVTP